MVIGGEWYRGTGVFWYSPVKYGEVLYATKLIGAEWRLTTFSRPGAPAFLLCRVARLAHDQTGFRDVLD
jgi:hypothetical protein